ncbi:MAG: DinB family protein [Gemmatimonadota bacterium]|nr:DinB family protein [Gemmatimonadota bacterium]
MRFADTLLPEFDNEMRITRTLLERIPFDQKDTKPNPKSRTLIELASHIANIPRLGALIVNTDERDMAAPGPPIVTAYPDSEALLGAFDANVAASREAIAALDDSKLGDTWSMRNGANVIMAMPRAAALRAMLMSHMIHHRGQLSAYLRLNNIPHPPIYGPTADMPQPR